MKGILLIIFIGIISVFTINAQQTVVKGSVINTINDTPIPDAIITIEGTELIEKTDVFGQFAFTSNIPLGEQIIHISKDGYFSNRYKIIVNDGKVVDIQDMILEVDRGNQVDLFTINLSDDELNDDTSGADNISGLLSSSKDVFQRTAAFEFSSSFFRVRGLDSDKGSVLINGIEMNKLDNGRPQWSNWGGLNDVMRNQEFTTGLTPSSYNFGGVLGTTNINTRASNYRKGGRVTYSSSNRSYTHRFMASYSSGLMKNGWAYTIMVGRRWAEEGFQEATLYDSNSFFTSVEKKINDNHSLNFTAIYAPNRRGKSSANTQEVYDLKSIKYNEYWGYLNGEKKNSRIKKVVEPILMLNYNWTMSEKMTLNTNMAYQFGSISNSRLGYPGGGNPSPSYYQNLPSYYLADSDGPDYANAYIAEQKFINNGQIDWERIFDANLTNNISGLPSAYVLYEDKNDDKQFTLNTIFNTEVNDNIIINGALNFKRLESENYAQVLDLFGGSYILNIDSFDGYQFDLSTPNRRVKEGEKFNYNYNLFATVISGYVQAQFNYNKVDFYLSTSIIKTDYQREGIYLNEAYLNNSLGKGDNHEFTGIGAKAGVTYKITGKHLLDVNVGYIIRAPSLRNTFTNSRSNDDVVGVSNGQRVDGSNVLSEEKITSLDASYIFRSPIVKAKITGYYTQIQNANEIGFFYADGVTGFLGGTSFIQEVLQGADKKHIGTELGTEAQITPTIKLKGAVSVGQYTYNNNPNLYVTSDDLELGFINYGQANLKDYKVAAGAQRAASIGFEYRDPDYWWFGATANFFSNTYVDVSPITRTNNFYKDIDGLPFNDYDSEVARELLKQEKFDDYMVVNLVGGKSWRVVNKYIGFFASVGNLLDQEYRTGGFEQGRSANYRQLKGDNSNPKRRFGPKYWYGRGVNYFLNFYVSF